VLTLVTMVFALGIALVLTGICEILQPDTTSWDVDWTFLVGFTLVQSLTMAVGFALAALLLNTPAAIVLFFAYWWVLPAILFAIAGIFPEFLDVITWINFQAALEPLYEWEVDEAEEWGQLLTSGALWIALPLGLGLWRILDAEVK
jgi:ABC-2 type transport system permease protein